MVSGSVVADNLAAADALLAQAAAAGAVLAALPEYFPIMGRADADKVAVREAEGDGPIQAFLADAAQRHGLWIVGGTLPLACADPARVRNTTLVFDPAGQRRARYDKIHLFGFHRGQDQYEESRTIEPGSQVVAIDTPYGRWGLSVCYDLRFPELYRAMGAPELIFAPAAFTDTTGRAHWELLVRARAVENLAYVIAPGQGGRHASGRETFGSTMIVDPWGEVLACQPKGPGCVIAEVDPQRLSAWRASLPALEHRTLAVQA
ncbi:MAG: carbon-nitrogen hydrolase family protein [Pseudomonadota bacterium]|nr:carbon-nitrogen hydrolase family protein [Pseudomonadota bacterium]